MGSATEQWLRGMVRELREEVAAIQCWSTPFPWTLSQHLEAAADEIVRMRKHVADDQQRLFHYEEVLLRYDGVLREIAGLGDVRAGEAAEMARRALKRGD
jgi:hypothetical protein